ncbi:LCP family protein [Gordonia sp. NPDC003425]
MSGGDDPTRRTPPRRHDDYHPPRAWSAAPGGSAAAGRSTRGGASAGAVGYAPTQKPEPVPRERVPNREPDRHRDGSRAGSAAPPRSPRRGTRPAEPPAPAPRRRARLPRLRRPRRLGRIILILLLVIVLGTVGLLFYYDSQLNRVDALPSYAGRPADTPGTTWLIVGSDSRSDLSAEQKRDLSTGDSDGSRTDTIMLVYKPPSGKAALISIPRDLYVPIPGQGQHKINAAYNFGGPQLLTRTVEQLSGIRIDHFAEIGFGGFDTLVDSVGGVTICLDQPLNDPKAGLNLPKGCQKLNGRQALGLVRTRAFPNADLERVVNQRKFLAALMAKATSPSVLLNPFRLFPFVSGAADSLTVDESTHIWNLAFLAWWLRSDPITTTTPNGGSASTDDGDSLLVDDDTERFFASIRSGQRIPEDLISNNGGAIG